MKEKKKVQTENQERIKLRFLRWFENLKNKKMQ